MRPTIKIGRYIYIFIIFSLGKDELKKLHKFETFCIIKYGSKLSTTC